jgi:hypothetical protein
MGRKSDQMTQMGIEFRFNLVSDWVKEPVRERNVVSCWPQPTAVFGRYFHRESKESGKNK